MEKPVLPIPALSLKIGEFLIGIGALKHWQVSTIINLQQNGDERVFGQIALDEKYIDAGALTRYEEDHMPS